MNNIKHSSDSQLVKKKSFSGTIETTIKKSSVFKKGKIAFDINKDFRRWNLELEKFDLEEVNLSNSLKEINLKIKDYIHKRVVAKSVSHIDQVKGNKEKISVGESLSKINKAVNSNKHNRIKLAIR